MADDQTWFVSDVDCLGDTHVLTVVGPDGSTAWVLVECGHWCGDCPLPVEFCDPPEHERGGTLPARVRARVWPELTQ